MREETMKANNLTKFATARIAAATLLLLAPTVFAVEVGQIKVSKGNVNVEREGNRLPATVGMVVRQSDTLVTGGDGSVGVTFLDNSLMSAGPNSVLAIDKFKFDSTTHVGEFDSTLKKGTLAVVSGKIVKQTPAAMKIRTPASIMGVRGTEFVVHVEDPAQK
jgi:hypothetical protein